MLLDEVDARLEVLGDIEGGYVFGRQDQMLQHIVILRVGQTCVPLTKLPVLLATVSTARTPCFLNNSMSFAASKLPTKMAPFFPSRWSSTQFILSLLRNAYKKGIDRGEGPLLLYILRKL
jgi:hypothetical protein